MEIKYKYLHKKMFGMHETEDIKELNGADYKVSLDKKTFDDIKYELELLNELRNDYIKSLDKVKELEEINEEQENTINSLKENIKEFESSDINRLKDQIESVESELKSVVETKEILNNVQNNIKVLIVGLEKFKERDKHDAFKIDESIIALKNFDLEDGVENLLVLINVLRDYLGKFFNEKNKLERINKELKNELEVIKEDKVDIVTAKKQVQNFKEVIDRKQRNIKKLKLEIENLRSKKGKQNIKDISLEYEGDSTYRAYKSYDLKKINRKNYKGEEVVVLPISMEKSKEEVMDYIQNSSIHNPKFDELKKQDNTVIWKIQTKNGYWQVVLAQK